MLRQFLVGGGVSLINIAIHALIMTMVVQVARAMGRKRQPHSSLVLIAVMIPTISVLMAAHTIEVFVWALAYLIFGAAPEGADLVYFAFVNYATLGYGDVLPVERWRLLGRDERQRHRESSARVQSEEIEAIASLVVTTALA